MMLDLKILKENFERNVQKMSNENYEERYATLADTHNSLLVAVETARSKKLGAITIKVKEVDKIIKMLDNLINRGEDDGNPLNDPRI